MTASLVPPYQRPLHEFTTANAGAALTVDFDANGLAQAVPLTAASCTLTFTSPKTHGYVTLRFVQDATGGRAIVLPGSVVGTAPALNTAATGVTVYYLYFNGLIYYFVSASGTGAAVTSSAPQNVTKAAAAVGTATDAARADHKHDVSTAAAVNVGAANAEGVASTMARSDHTHAVVDFAFASQAQGDLACFNGTNWVRLAAGTSGQYLKTLGAGANPAWTTLLTASAPANVTKSGATVGTATTLARADHKHDVSTAAAVSVSGVNSEGTATTLARSDHTHAGAPPVPAPWVEFVLSDHQVTTANSPPDQTIGIYPSLAPLGIDCGGQGTITLDLQGDGITSGLDIETQVIGFSFHIVGGSFILRNYTLLYGTTTIGAASVVPDGAAGFLIKVTPGFGVLHWYSVIRITGKDFQP